MILDQYGNPVTAKLLDQELAAPALTGVRSLWNFDQMAQGLTPAGLAMLLRDAADGDHNAYLTLAEEMEERDGHYAAVLGVRKRAVSGLPLVVEAASDEKKDLDLADEVRALLARPGTKTMLEDALDSLGKGFSVVEIIWDRSSTPWVPAKYAYRDPRFFQFSQEDMTEIRLRDSEDLLDGLPLEPFKFICHTPRHKSGVPIRGGLARLVAWNWMFKHYAIKDWMAFAEVFGMPLRVGRYRPGEDQANIDILKMAVANLGMDAAAVIPEGMQIEFQELGSATGSADLFQRLADWMDSQISKAVLGQTMTTDPGSSQAQATVHNEVRHDLRNADAAQLAETLLAGLVIPFIILNWGPQDRYPRVFLREPEAADASLVADVLAKLVPLGLRVEAGEVRDKLGFSDPDDDAECLQVPGPTYPMASARNTMGSPRAHYTPDQQALEALISNIMPDAVSVTTTMGQNIVGLIRQAKSVEDLQILLAAYLDDVENDPFQDMLHRALVAAEFHGRDTIGGEE